MKIPTRYRLRTVLVVMLLLGAFFAHCFYVRYGYHREQRTIRELRKDADIRVASAQVGWLGRMAGFVWWNRVISLDIEAEVMDDVNSLRHLRHVKYVTVDCKPFSDADFLASFASRRLVYVNLHGTAITDRTIEYLVKRSAKSIRVLDFSETKVTDNGIRLLSESSPNIEILRLCVTDISDASVIHLGEWPNLAELDVRWTNVSDEGCDKIIATVPIHTTVLHL